MASKYCYNCGQVVEAKRRVGVGTLILALLTCGFSLLLIPFYSKRCYRCNGTNLGRPERPIP